MEITLLVFTVFVSVGFNKNNIFAAKIPSGLEFCHQSESDFNKCVSVQVSEALKLFKDGYSELGIPKIEPFTIPHVEIIGESNPSGSLSQIYDNMLTYGIYISEVYDSKFFVSEKECYWDFKVLTPYVYVEADYKLNGRLLMFPINGNGKCNITITNLTNHHQALCEVYTKNGKSFLRHTKYQLNMNGEKILFNFENIISGNEQFSNEIMKTINENSQDVFKEVKNGLEQVWAPLHSQVANIFMAKFPLDVLFPE